MSEHPREITLELYVLGSETLTAEDRDAIHRHLDHCAGCDALAASMEKFYGDLRAELGNYSDNLPVLSPDELPIRTRQSIGPRGTHPPAGREVDPRFPFRVARWIVRNPVIATAGAFAGVMFASVLLLLFIPKDATAPRDLNPVELRAQGVMLQATNRYGEQLAEIEVSRDVGESYRNRPEIFEKITGLIDADGDGTNDILWVERWTGDQKVTQRIHCVALNPVRPLWTHEVDRELDYIHKPDANVVPYSITQVRAGDFDRDGRPEIYALLTSGSFSNQLLKLNAADGSETGCYVHTGGLNVLEFFDVDGDSIQEIILGGTNNSWSEATIAILDPRRVGGQSVHSRPYALRNSVPANEKAYIRIPRTIIGMYNPRNTRNFIEAVLPNPQRNVIQVGVKDDSEESRASITYYITFRTDFSVLGIDRGDVYTLVADSLYRTGKIPTPVDQAYFTNYARTISWWDGERWVQKPSWNKIALQTRDPA